MPVDNYSIFKGVNMLELWGVSCQSDLKWNKHIYNLRPFRKSQLLTEVSLTTYLKLD